MKLLGAWVFSASLVLSLANAYAGNTGEKPLPNFYLLEELNNGQTLRISTCYIKDYSHNSDCPTKVDVDREDYDQFLEKLNSEIKSSQKSHIGHLFALSALLLIRKKGYLNFVLPAITIMGLSINVSGDVRVYEVLHDQILSGVVTLGINSKANRLRFERFESFLQEYGHAVVAED